MTALACPHCTIPAGYQLANTPSLVFLCGTRIHPDNEGITQSEPCIEIMKIRTALEEAHRQSTAILEESVEVLAAELEMAQGVVDAAEAVVDGDISVYADVPNSHELMNALDHAVGKYREQAKGSR